jgi:23S rRNA (cytosine1962-C5)-methyltransferase
MEQKMQMFENRLTKVFKRLQKIANKKNVSCYRIYDHDLPEFPFVLDIYDHVIFGSEYKRKHGMEDAEHEAWMEACQTCIKTVTGIDALYLKERKRIISRQEQYTKQETAKVEKIVQENGLSFIINLSDYLDDRLFLDNGCVNWHMVNEC